MPDEKSVKHMSKETLKSLCELASTESDRRLIQSAATWGLSGKQANKKYGIDNNTLKINQVKEAIVNAQETHDEIIKLVQLQETALLRSMGIEDSVSDTESFEDESDLESVIESDSDENDSHSKSSVSTVHGESKAADEGQSSNHSTGNTRFNPDDLSKDVAGVVNPAPPNETLLSWLRDNSLNWFSFFDVAQYLKFYSPEVLHQVLLDVTYYLSTGNCDLTEEEERAVEVSRQAFSRIPAA